MPLRNPVAVHIRRHLGAHKFEVITGAFAFAFADDTLSFRLPRTINGINAVSVKWHQGDTCTMTFVRRMHFGTVTKIVRSIEDVPIETLRPLFTEVTGLATDTTDDD